MSARLLALVGLLNCVVPVCLADSNQPAASVLVVYLKADAGQPAGTMEWMKRELSPLLGAAGYRIEWRTPQTGVADAESLVVVEIHGACGVLASSPSPALSRDRLNSLASTAVSEGRVLPFATVNCPNLNRTLEPAIASEAGARRDFLYGRAMARVLAHELYHILAGTRWHTAGGLSKPNFTTADLLSEQFEFEAAILAKFRQSAPDHPAETPSEIVTGDGSGR